MRNHFKFNFSKNKIIIFTILALFLIFSRFYKLTSIPTAFHHDEMIYVVQAQAIAQNGTGLFKNWQPFSLRPFSGLHAELPATLMVPAFLIFKNQVLAARFTHAFLGLFMPLVVAFFVQGLFSNKKITYSSIFLAAANPWLWQFSRMAFDAYFSIFFYLLASGLLLNLKNWQKLYSLPFFLIGFFQYQGLKVVFLPWILILLIFLLFKENSVNKKNFTSNKTTATTLKVKLKTQWDIFLKYHLSKLVILVSALILFACYLLILLPQSNAVSRMDQLIFNNQEFNNDINTAVNSERRMAIQSPLGKIFSNKITLYLLYIIKSYARLFSLDILFLSGEPNLSPFSVWSHGIFYLIDLFLMIAGVAYLINNNKLKLQTFTLFSLTIISPIAAILNASNNWYMFRAALFYLMLLIYAAIGIQWIVEKYPKFLKYLLTLYLLSIINFSYHYFYRYPVYSAQGVKLEERLLANYLKRLNSEKKVKIIAREPYYIYLSALFYQNLINKNNIELVQSDPTQESYQISQFNYSKGCVDLNELKDKDQILIAEADLAMCPTSIEIKKKDQLNNQEKIINSEKTLDPFADAISISSLLDSGELIRIYNDPICSQFELIQFSTVKTLAAFNIEKLSDQEFCQLWLSDLRKLKI